MAKLVPGSFELNAANQNHLVRNLLKRTRELSPETIAEGMSWYPSGKSDAEHVGEGDPEVGAAVLSKLSPQQAWGINRQMGLQIKSMPEDALDPLREAFHNKTDKDELTAIRSSIVGGTPLGLTTNQAILGAENVLKGRVSPRQAFKMKGAGSKKTGHFSVSLATGGDTALLPVDTHAYDAALDRYDIPYGVGSQHMKDGHAYDFVQQAYLTAHQKALKQKLIPSEMTPAAFQATHWVHHQLGKASVSARVQGMAKSNIRQSLRYAEKNPVLDPANHGLQPLSTEQDYNTRLEHFAKGIAGGDR
jgi:hypothetical protein